jgi:hypothetical protein
MKTLIASCLLLVTNVGCCYTCYCQNGSSSQFQSIPGFANITCALNCSAQGTGVSGLERCPGSSVELSPIPDPEFSERRRD